MRGANASAGKASRGDIIEAAVTIPGTYLEEAIQRSRIPVEGVNGHDWEVKRVVTRSDKRLAIVVLKIRLAQGGEGQ